jgi:hypothetical protein
MGALIMNSQEELAASLQQLTDALARRPSIVRHGNKPRTGSVQERREMTAPIRGLARPEKRGMVIDATPRFTARNSGST